MTQNVPPVSAKLRTLAELMWADPTRTQESLADELGVDRRTLHRWRHSEQWLPTFRDVGLQYIEPMAPTAILALRAAWKKGNPAGALEMLRNFGLIGNERIEVETTMTAAEVIALQKTIESAPAD